MARIVASRSPRLRPGIVEPLLGHGHRLRIYDPRLDLSRIVGRNKRMIDTKMPHLASLLHGELSSALGQQGLVVAAQKCAPVTELAKWMTPRHHVLDVNGWPELRGLASTYEGFCW